MRTSSCRAPSSGGRRSTDGGLTWDTITFQDPNSDWVPSVLFDPTQVGTAYALVHDLTFSDTALYHSADAGSTWTQRLVLPFFSYDELHVNASGDLILSGQMGISRSTDGGMSLEIALMDVVSDVEPSRFNPSVYWAVGIDKIWSSIDGGAELAGRPSTAESALSEFDRFDSGPIARVGGGLLEWRSVDQPRWRQPLA